MKRPSRTLVRVICVTLVVTAGILAAGLMPASAVASDVTVRRDLVRGIAIIRASSGDYPLTPGQMRGVRAKLIRDRASTAAGRRAKALAIRGFTWWVKSTTLAQQAQQLEPDLDLVNTVVSYEKKGANALRAAGAQLGLNIGKIGGW